jgi:hypothetical protein
MLDPAPPVVGEGLLALISLTLALGQPARVRRVFRWAGHYRPRLYPRVKLTLRLLANRGRDIAVAAHLGSRNPQSFARGLAVEGQEHADRAAGSGMLLVGFHLGPPAVLHHFVTRRAVVVVAGTGDRYTLPPARSSWRLHAQEFVSLREPSHRVSALYELRRRLLLRQAVYMTADGGAPRPPEAFRVPLPGGDLVIQPGWLALRRLSGATTILILRRWVGRQIVVSLQPPLPPPDPDPERDTEMCRSILVPLIQAYVNDSPEQCVRLALSSNP